MSKKGKKKKITYKDIDNMLKEPLKLINSGSEEMGTEKLEELLKKYPDDLNIKFEIGVILGLETETKRERGRDILKQLLNTNYPYKTRVMEIVGKMAVYRNDKKEAYYYLKPLLSTNRKDDALFYLGRLSYKNGEFDEARDYYLKAVSLDSVKKRYYIYELGNLESFVGNYDEARVYYNYLIDNNLGSKLKNKSLFRLGLLEKRLGNYAVAQKYFDRIDDHSYKYLGILQKVFIEMHNDNYKAAQTLFETIGDEWNISEAVRRQYFQTKLALDCKQGNLDNTQKETYYAKQYLNYDESKTIEHISRHFEGCDAKEIYNFAIETIKDGGPNDFDSCDTYFIKTEFPEYPLVEVTTYKNTKNIITMFQMENTAVNNIRYEEKVKTKSLN